MDAVHRPLPPRFLNRIDEIVLFQRLGREQMDSIVKIQLERVEKLLADRRMAIHLDPGALHWLAERGYDPVYGARPLKRVIQKELVDPIARKLLAGDLEDGSVIRSHPGGDKRWRSARRLCTGGGGGGGKKKKKKKKQKGAGRRNPSSVRLEDTIYLEEERRDLLLPR